MRLFPILVMLVLAVLAGIVLAAVNGSLGVTAPAADGTVLNDTYAIQFTFNGTANVTIQWQNASGWATINSSSNAASPYTYAFDTSSQADAYRSYNLSINVTNSTNASDTQTTYRYNLTVDNTAPAVTMVNTSFSTASADPTLWFNFTDAASPTASCALFIDGAVNATNATTQASTNTGISASGLTDGAHTAYVNCTDLAGKYDNSGSITITVDTGAPTVNLVNASFSTTDTTPSITFNYTDALSATATCTLYFDGIAYGDNASTANNTNTALTVNASLVDGSFGVTVSCTDTMNNVGASSSITVVVDTTPPVLSSVSSGDPTTTAATITWITDEAANSSVNYGTTTALGTLSGSATLTTSHSRSLIGLSASTTYYYNVTSCDALGHCNTTGPNSVTTDAVASSSGGGGGGGGFKYLDSTPRRFMLSTLGMQYFKTVDNAVHKIRIESIEMDAVTLAFESDPIFVTLKEGESKNVDLNNDGEADVLVRLISFKSASATLEIGKPVSVVATAPSETVVAETVPARIEEEVPAATAQPSEESAPSISEKTKSSEVESTPSAEERGTPIWPWVLVAIIAITLILFWQARRVKNGERHSPKHR